MSEATFSLFRWKKTGLKFPKEGKTAEAGKTTIIGVRKWGKCLTYARYQIRVQMADASKCFDISV
jgi:hypothetical protein